MNQPMGIAEQVRELAVASTGWRHNQQVALAYTIFDALNEKVFDNMLPQAVIGFDDTGRLKRISKYHYEGDNLSIPHHIDLRIGISQEQMVVGLIMTIEQMKGEVYDKKSNWYFSQTWQKAMATHGLVCTESGHVEKINPSFGKLLAAIEGYGDATPAQQKEALKKFKSAYSDAEAAGAMPILGDSDYGEVALEESHLVQFMAKDKASKPKASKKTQKFACQCNGDSNGSTTFWAVRIAPGTICGACKAEFLPAEMA